MCVYERERVRPRDPASRQASEEENEKTTTISHILEFTCIHTQPTHTPARSNPPHTHSTPTTTHSCFAVVTQGGGIQKDTREWVRGVGGCGGLVGVGGLSVDMCKLKYV